MTNMTKILKCCCKAVLIQLSVCAAILAACMMGQTYESQRCVVPHKEVAMDVHELVPVPTGYKPKVSGPILDSEMPDDSHTTDEGYYFMENGVRKFAYFDYVNKRKYICVPIAPSESVDL